MMSVNDSGRPKNYTDDYLIMTGEFNVSFSNEADIITDTTTVTINDESADVNIKNTNINND